MSLEFSQELGQRVWYVLRAQCHSVFHLLTWADKWLGKGAINALAVDGKGGKAELIEKVNRWVSAHGRNVTQPGKFLYSVAQVDNLSSFQVMIVSYETLRTLSVHLANCSIGLLLCDEGHRLKNSGNTCSLEIFAIYSRIEHRFSNFPSAQRTGRQASRHPHRYSHPGKRPHVTQTLD